MSKDPNICNTCNLPFDCSQNPVSYTGHCVCTYKIDPCGDPIKTPQVGRFLLQPEDSPIFPPAPYKMYRCEQRYIRNTLCLTFINGYE